MNDGIPEMYYFKIRETESLHQSTYRDTIIAQKMKHSIEDFVTFTEEILNGKLHFLCSVSKAVSKA